ncbi:hypothetical protein JW948_09540 [bacterium]|nr:hypothetical protein [bacterium]
MIHITKKVSALIAVCLAVSSVLCQTPETIRPGCPECRLLRLDYENSGGENGLTTFDYNGDGLLEKAVWELDDGSRISLNSYTHDKDGRLIRKYREYSDSLISDQAFEYNNRGQLITERFERSDSVSGLTTYEYDDQGRLAGMRCRGFNGWFYGDIAFTYDEAGSKIKGDIRHEGEHAGVILYSYDECGNLIREHWDFSGRWSQTFIYEYEACPAAPPAVYASSNVFISGNPQYRLIGEHYDYSGKTGGPSFYFYGKGGKLLSKRFERSDGFSTETDYLYDCKGKLTRSCRHYSNGLFAVFSYESGPSGKLATRSFRRTDGVSGSESYAYDSRSNLVSAQWINVDSWLTGALTFTSAEDGTLTGGHYQGADGSGAEIRFEYDAHGNLLKIHWDFASGATQTYVFEYEYAK